MVETKTKKAQQKRWCGSVRSALCGVRGSPGRLVEHDCAPWVGADATINVQVNETIYRQLRQAYEEVVANGYGEPFAVFVVNHCDGDYRVKTR